MARDEDWPSGLLWGLVVFHFGRKGCFCFRARTDRPEPRRRDAHEASSCASAICGEVMC